MPNSPTRIINCRVLIDGEYRVDVPELNYTVNREVTLVPTMTPDLRKRLTAVGPIEFSGDLTFKPRDGVDNRFFNRAIQNISEHSIVIEEGSEFAFMFSNVIFTEISKAALSEGDGPSWTVQFIAPDGDYV